VNVTGSTGERGRTRHLAIDRLAALTDGVFAIAITLLSLEVVVPLVEDAARSSDLSAALFEQWPSYVAYAVTFFLVGAYWVNHHRMFNLLRGVDHKFLLLNILFLMAIAIIPFPNALLAEYALNPELRGVAAAVYGLAMAALAITFNAVWWYAGRNHRLIKREADPAHLRAVLNSYLMGPVFYGIGVALSSFAPLVSLAIYVALPLGYFFEGPVAKIDQGYLKARE
jgi:uncharacterized membrane protein